MSRAVFMPMSLKTVRMATNNGVDPESVVDEPETPAESETPKPEDPTVTESPEDPGTPDTPAEPTPTVTPDPGSGTGGNGQTSIIKNLIQNISKSISKLFSRFRR